MNRLVSYMVLALVIISSCTEKNSEIILTETRVVHPQVHATGITEVLRADKMCVCDSFLIVIGRDDEPCFYVYDRNGYQIKGSFGMNGNGPSDFLFPFFFGGEDYVGGKLEVYDVNLASIKEIDLHRCLHKQENAVVAISLPKEIIGSPDLFRAGSVYYGNMDNGMGLFFRFDVSSGQFDWIDFPSSLLEPERDFSVMNMNRISYSESRKEIVSAMFYYNRVFLYDEQGNLQKSVRLGEKEVCPVLGNENSSVMGESLLCFTDVQSDENYIYLMAQSVEEERSFSPTAEMKSRIVVLDWNLDYVKTYSLPHYSQAFLVDAGLHRIVYIARTSEGNTDLFYFDMTE
ncbi:MULTISPECIES: hypothetical protein [unclassified Bacteroides]|uniref:hypothetical protein n=1 Tax=unclassified Bacteroides TaxID=2646097 RepID=UPI001123C9AE|nr:MULTISPECIES: hypothetical protein [unclassified Bacteroides]